jgi:hypothetical protein
LVVNTGKLDVTPKKLVVKAQDLAVNQEELVVKA